MSDLPFRIFGMELRLTLLDPRHLGARVDVAIDAPADTPFAAVSDQLAAALGVAAAASEHRFHCAREPIDGSQPLGLPPLLQGAVLTLGTGQESAAPGPARALLEAQVIAGPDAGTVVPLPIGRHTIGRGSGHLIRLTDPDASRTHAELLVSATRIELRDVGSANGTWLGDRRLGADAESLPAEARVRIGAALITVRPPSRPPAGLSVDGCGHLRINRGPQLRPARAELEIRFPAEPDDRPAARLPWLAMLLPLLLAIPLAVLWKQPTFLLFALMTPLLMAGQYLTDRRNRRREAVGRLARHQTVSARRQQDLELAIAADAAYLESARPDLARLAVMAGTPTDELWRRSIDGVEFLSLRLGRGPEASQITVRRPPSDDAGGHDIEAERFIHSDIPIAVDLIVTRILGICGPRRTVLGLARSLIGQISALHSPHEVRIEVLTADPSSWPDWHWVTWLPHYDGVGRGFSPGAGSDPGSDDGFRHRVIVLDGAHLLRRRPELAAELSLTARSRNGGSTAHDRVPLFLCLDRAEPDLPVECGATITLDATPGGPAVLRRPGVAASPFVPDLASERWAERLARDLAPLRDATPEPGQDLPDAIRLVDLLADADRVRPTDPDDLARHWRRGTGLGPSATLGMTASGPFRIDLSQDGPHLLVGGTTGAGKSELLRTLVAALSVASGPDAMSFLLVDYKGGAAFQECANLPQVGGVITDLDPSLARRALASLTAELRRRERLLRLAGSVDVDGYCEARAGRQDLPVMPRLVVVVDEFRVLAEELPEFVSGLVRTATVGRSLGVHLVLATQRPTGVVSAEISANVNLRIALRVNDGADSRDLIDDPGAAGLPADRPGRALARSGAGPLVGFQTAVVSGRTRSTMKRPPVVRRLELGLEVHPVQTFDPMQRRDLMQRRDPTQRADPVDPACGVDPGHRFDQAYPGPAAAGSAASSDLALIAQAARAAAERLNLAPAQPLWVEPLPQSLRLESLLALDLGPDAAADPSAGRRQSLRLPFALLDLPADQRQEVLAWQLDGSHLAVSGGPRSGRSTTLQSIARAAGAVAGADQLHVYAVDGAGALAQLRGLPRVEAVIPVHDTERAERLLRFLTSEIDARQGAGAAEPRGADPLRVGPELCPEMRLDTYLDMRPDIALLIDGWEALTGSWAAVDHGRLIDQLTCVLRDGPAVGVHAAISGGRTLLTGAVSALLTERVLLRFADPADAVLAGVPSSRVLKSQPTGRGLVIGPRFLEAAEIQVAVGQQLGSAQRESAQRGSARSEPAEGDASGDGPGRVIRPPAVQRSWQIPELPRRLEHHQLISAWCRQVSVGEPGIDFGPRCVPVGLGGDEALVLGLDLDAAPVTLVVGPTGSGRTSALRCITDGLARLGEPVLWVSLSGSSRVDGVSMIDGSNPRAAAALAAALAARPGATVLVDDTQTGGIAGTVQDGVEDLLAAHVAVGRLVVACSASELLGAYRGLLAVVRTARSGLLLGPSGPGEADVFGLRVERRPAGPPGRALLIQSGRAVTMQLSLPPPLGRQWRGSPPSTPGEPDSNAMFSPPPRRDQRPARHSGEKVNL